MNAPWRDRDRLAPLLAAWRVRAAQRPLFRTVTGPGWVSISLTGDDRAAFFLGALPGAVLAFPFTAPLPKPLHQDLAPTRGDPLFDLLREATLTAIGLLPDDLVIECQFTGPNGPRRLRQQLFGQRGGLVVLDERGRMLWTAHPSPHPSLVDATTAPEASAAAADDHELAAWSEEGLARLIRQRETALADRLQRAIDRRAAVTGRLVANLAADLEKADGGEQRRRDAEALAANLHTVSRGTESITVADPRDGESRTIALDPALAPHANLEHYFKLARKAARGREVIADRLATARAELATTTAAGEALNGVLTDDDEDLLPALHAFAADHKEQLSGRQDRSRRTGRAPDQPARPFRRYRIDDRWDVWVGRSNQENDELTHRASHPNDLWLHAQGVSGSHVILRTGGRPDIVPRRVLEKAAALAALHSKARNSSLVPVIWTERRYVRRPRKSAPGTAVCLRDENVFVEPGVMAGVVPA